MKAAHDLSDHARTSRVPGSLPAWAAFPLLLPWSIAGTFLSVAMAFFMSQAGMSTAAIAVYLSAQMIPDTFKVLWAPLIDTTLGPRRWYFVGVAGLVVMLAVIAFIPVTRANLPLLTGVAIACAFFSTFVHLTTDIVITYDVADDHKGRAGGWNSASNLGGGAVGGGLAIVLAQLGLPAWSPAISIALLCAISSPSVFLAAPRPPFGAAAGSAFASLRALSRDVWAMIRSQSGALAVLLVVLPIGSASIISLLPAIARDWHAGAGAVVFISGFGGGLVQIVGALVGGILCDRLDRKATYCVIGAVIAVLLVSMAWAPRTPLTYIVFSLLFLLASGSIFAAFAAVEFEAAGGGAAATKCMLLVCLSNLSIDLVQVGDGFVHDAFGVVGMLLFEAGLGGLALLAFSLIVIGSRRKQRLALKQASYAPA